MLVVSPEITDALVAFLIEHGETISRVGQIAAGPRDQRVLYHGALS
jgi:hypothetical protein